MKNSRKLLLLILGVTATVTFYGLRLGWGPRIAVSAKSLLPGGVSDSLAGAQEDEHSHEHGDEHDHEQAVGGSERVLLSSQARQNLELVSKPLRPTEYWRTIVLPGTVVDRPGLSDRGVVAPVTAIVTRVHHFPGDTVTPGEPLFSLRIVGESFHTAQTELFKASKEIEIAREQQNRLANAAVGGAIPQSRLMEVENELKRLAIAMQAYRQDLQIRGLTPEQIDGIAGGQFVSEVVVVTPAPPTLEETKVGTDPASANVVPASEEAPRLYEMQELRVVLGQQVQAGEALCLLSQHESLFIEGHAFRQELPLLQRAAEQGLPIQVRLEEDDHEGWDSAVDPVMIHHISNQVNADQRTLSFFLPLKNPSRTYEREGRVHFLWRFRPGQRVRLTLNVEKMENVFVLPADAVVREGPEVFVFRQDGEWFERKPVRVLLQNADEVILSNDGSIAPGVYVAQTGAVQLNRVLKSQTQSTPAGVHVHADGSVHANH